MNLEKGAFQQKYLKHRHAIKQSKKEGKNYIEIL